MDNLVSEAQDVEIPELNFGLPATAQFVTDRRQVITFHQAHQSIHREIIRI